MLGPVDKDEYVGRILV